MPGSGARRTAKRPAGAQRSNGAVRAQAALEHAPVALYQTDRDGRITFWNAACRRLFALDSAQCLEAWTERSHPEDRTRVAATWAALIREPREMQFEYRSVDANGELRHLSEHVVVIRDSRAGGFIATVVDDTARVARTRNDRRVHETIEKLPVGITHADAERKTRWCNPALCKMLGYTAEELTNLTYRDITHPEDLQQGAGSQEQLRHADRNSYMREQRFIRKDKSVVWMRVTTAMSHDDAGKADGYLAVFEDITQRKQAEAEVERVHRELLQASHQAGMAEVATSVLHNVGNVLNNLNVSAKLVAEQTKHLKTDSLARVAALLEENQERLDVFLRDDPRGRRLPSFLVQLSANLQTAQQTLLRELDSLSSSVEHIKDIVATQQSYAKRFGVTETLEVAAIVEESLTMNMAAFTRHHIEVVRDFAAVSTISVDKHKVLQILVNLEWNAKHACMNSPQPERRVTLRIAPAGGAGVQIQVIDNGIGIEPMHMPKLFTHGFTTRADGHGFGLHGAALAAKELGGKLEAHSAGPGRGATFTLTLPLQPPEQRLG